MKTDQQVQEDVKISEVISEWRGIRDKALSVTERTSKIVATLSPVGLNKLKTRFKTELPGVFTSAQIDLLYEIGNDRLPAYLVSKSLPSAVISKIKMLPAETKSKLVEDEPAEVRLGSNRPPIVKRPSKMSVVELEQVLSRNHKGYVPASKQKTIKERATSLSVKTRLKKGDDLSTAKSVKLVDGKPNHLVVEFDDGYRGMIHVRQLSPFKNLILGDKK